MLFYTVVVFFISFCVVLRWKHRKYYKLSKILKKYSIDVTLPIIGVSHLFAGNGEVIMRGIETVGRQVLEKKGIVAVWLAHRFFVVIADPVLANHVSKTCLEKHDIMTKCMGLVLRNSSIVAPVSIWRIHRRILTPTFGSKNVRDYLNVFTEQSEVLVEQVRKSLNTPVPILEYYMRYSMEAVCQTTLGVQLDVQRATSQHRFILSLEEAIRLVGERFLKPWLFIDFIYKLLPQYKNLKKLREYGDCFLEEIIHSQRQQKNSDMNKFKKNGKNLMELLIEDLENAKGIIDQEIKDEALGVLVAGTETTAILSGFISHMLATHPDVQDKAFEELMEVFENNEPLTPEHLSRLKYLDAIIKETLRLYPPVPIVARQVEEDCVLPSGVVLPKGCGILLHLWAINRNPDYWGADADQFRPERFLDSDLKHTAQFASFSFGPRNCIGKLYAMTSIKALFATILRHFRFAPASGSGSTEKSANGLRLTYAVTMKDVNNFPVQLQLRNLKICKE